MPIVEVNGEEIEFPDDMSDQDIEAVLQKQYPKAQEPPSDFNLALQLIGNVPGPLSGMARGMAPLADGEPMESKGVRLAQGALDPALGIAQAVPHGISALATDFGLSEPNTLSRAADELAAQQDVFTQNIDAGFRKMRQDDGKEGFDAWRLAGNVASPANILPGKIAASLGPGKSLGGRMVKGAITGGLFGGTMPATDPNRSFADQKLEQVGTGAALNAALPLIGEAGARAIAPNVDDAQKLLMQEGVRLTPGQIAGGFPKTLEDKLTSVPIFGDSITAARQRGIEDLNRAVANRALEPIGKSLPKNVNVGHDLVNYVDDALGKEYDALVPKLSGKFDNQLLSDVGQLQMLAENMAPAQASRFNQILETQVIRKVSGNGSITGESLKEMESQLGRLSRGYAKSPDPDVRDLGDALLQLQSNLREWLARQNPQHAEQLRAINKGWANYTRLRDAAGSLGAKDGVFSPAQLQNRVRAMGSKNGFAKGTNLMQDLSGAAKEVMPSAYPDSGTAGRWMMGMGTLGGGAMVSPVALGGIGTGAAAYSRPGQAILQYLLADPKLGKASKPAANMLRKATSPSDLAALIFGG